MNSRELLQILNADGWVEVACEGSHHQFRHPTKPGRVTVMHPTRDFKPGTLISIFKQAQLARPSAIHKKKEKRP